mmetsp:Transcript_3683/g.9417  ORF Transcript_3683/g.9417 Transcript_3683/m.9417 type:complete len:204 (+) Transcript_3683:394-1005(+)
MVDVPDMSHWLLGVRQSLLIGRWPVLADHRRNRLSTGRLCLPDSVPPALMALHVWEPLRCTWIWHLGPVVVADTTMDVVELRGKILDHLREVGICGVCFCHIDPVRKVRREFHLRKLRDEFARHPWTVQEALAVSLVTHEITLLLLPSQRLCKELLSHPERERVLQAVGNYQGRVELLCSFHLLLEDLQVCANKAFLVRLAWL